MGAVSKIEWTDSTWNPIRARNTKTGKVGWFCVHASEGCRNCYAEGFNHVFGTQIAYLPQALKAGEIELFLDEKALTQPLRWKKPRKIFVGSMTDLFGDFVQDEWLDKIFAVMLAADWHQYQVLTKRPERMANYLGADDSPEVIAKRHAAFNSLVPALRPAAKLKDNFWAAQHIWLGISAEDQDNLIRRMRTFSTIGVFGPKFLSLEPLLGPVDLTNVTGGTQSSAALALNALSGNIYRPGGGSLGAGSWKLDWVIVGGESGTRARPMHPDWVRAVRDQCAKFGIAFMFKQWGAWAPGEIVGPADGPRACAWWFDNKWDVARYGKADQDNFTADDEPDLYRVGKTHAGRVLDGQVHDAFPQVAA